MTVLWPFIRMEQGLALFKQYNRKLGAGARGFFGDAADATDIWTCGTEWVKIPRMKKTLGIVVVGLSFIAGTAFGVRDWHDLDAVHKHVTESIHEMERARAANHYDMAGHGAKAEEHLRAAEHELGEAIAAAKRD